MWEWRFPHTGLLMQLPDWSHRTEVWNSHHRQRWFDIFYQATLAYILWWIAVLKKTHLYNVIFIFKVGLVGLSVEHIGCILTMTITIYKTDWLVFEMSCSVSSVRVYISRLGQIGLNATVWEDLMSQARDRYAVSYHILGFLFKFVYEYNMF